MASSPRKIGCIHLGIAGLVLALLFLGVCVWKPDLMPGWLADPLISDREPVRKRLEYLENNLRIERGRPTRNDAEIERLERERTRARDELER